MYQYIADEYDAHGPYMAYGYRMYAVHRSVMIEKVRDLTSVRPVGKWMDHNHSNLLSQVGR
jgi:hypothetical protein